MSDHTPSYPVPSGFPPPPAAEVDRLFSAVRSGQISIIANILMHNEDALEWRSALHANATPLIYATRCKQGVVVDFLLDNGARVDAVDTNGDTALHHVVRLEDADGIAQKLLLAGADAEMANNDKKTPQRMAILRGKTGLITFMKDLREKRVNADVGTLHEGLAEGLPVKPHSLHLRKPKP